MSGGTHIRIGGVRIDFRSGGSLAGAAEHLSVLARDNIRAFQADPRLREEAIRRVLSPPCPVRCYVSEDGNRHDCNCGGGFQYASDPEQQSLEGCQPADVWSDFPSLIAGHYTRCQRLGEDPNTTPIVADCDDLTPTSLSVAAWIAWFAPERLIAGAFTEIGGIASMALGMPRFMRRELNLGEYRDNGARFAVAITLPPDEPGKPRVGHAYGLTNRVPASPQPRIEMPLLGGPWYVWDDSAHRGMARPNDGYYPKGEVVAFEISKENINGLQRAA